MASGLAGGAAGGRRAAPARVAFVKTRDRAAGVVRAIDLLGIGRFDGRDLFVKPKLQQRRLGAGLHARGHPRGAARDAAGAGRGPLPWATAAAWATRGRCWRRRTSFASRGTSTLKSSSVDELGADDWELIQPPGSHWRHGFALPRLGPEGHALLTELLEGLQATVVPFDEGLARLAHDGWLRFGRGRHPAGLNVGDCFAYALAKQCGEPLLFKGEDFARTDLAAAL